ncbi:MAG: hypothetical protein IPI58_03120 [Alphaproteobacteria bacterium]|nr:MAG: hypothetical protein IPI58_03120 [Alphaproteobacteria bacterium]
MSRQTAGAACLFALTTFFASPIITTVCFADDAQDKEIRHQQLQKLIEKLEAQQPPAMEKPMTTPPERPQSEKKPGNGEKIPGVKYRYTIPA